ncbi:MAG: flagellar biosynthesis protein FlhB [Nitrospinae bacterium]|nr:flagellar biosynthesis protein FlhB [Nitrospinota bacterium]
MADEDKTSKTEEPTSKRLGDARQKGQVAKSKEVSFVAVMFAGLLALTMSGEHLYSELTEMMRYYFSEVPKLDIGLETTNMLFDTAFLHLLQAVLPCFLALLVVSFFANVAQIGGFLFTLEPLQPKFSKINPMKGVKRIFSVQSLVELAKSLFKIGVTGTVAFLAVSQELSTLPYTAFMSTGEFMVYMVTVSLKIVFYILLVMIAMAAADFSFQKWDHNDKLKMTKQEVKDEAKQTEGNPETKRRIRQAQMDMARKRMMQEVPTADVVITNPTHFAIALKYEEGMHAPTVVAKGQDKIALKIREIAMENNVPIVEDKPLARSIFKTTEIGDIIPPELYQAVAEVLAYIYKLKGNRQVA